jgi:hypothetical protein
LNCSGEAYESPNTTQKTERDSIPWRCWISDTTQVPTPKTGDYLNVIGLFEGAQYYTNGWYRPKMNCIMRGSGNSPFFCEVCRESIASYLLKRAMIGSVSPNINSTVTNNKIEIKCAQIDTFPIKFNWYFNDTLLEGYKLY